MSGYTRQQSYIDGDVILAEHTNDEFDLLEEVFSTTLGHKHDGTAAEGPTIDLLSDDDGDTKVQVEEGTDDDTIRFDAAGVEQMTITGSKISLNRETDLNFTTVANAAVTFNSAALFNIRPQFDGGTSGVSSPFTVDSTFKVTNLNCDLLDDISSTQFLRSDVADQVDGTLTFAISPVLNNNTNFLIKDFAGAGQPAFAVDTSDNLFFGSAAFDLKFLGSGAQPTYNSNTIWHAGNDGAGSGLDADLLDGVQGSVYARLDQNNIFINTGSTTITRSKGGSGFGSFFAEGSGTNESHYFLGNITTGEIGRLTANNSGQVTVRAGIGSGFLVFQTAGTTERMRIDSSGNLLIGQTSTLTPGSGNTTLGLTLLPQGSIYSSGNISGFNRNSNGDIIRFFQSGTQVGSISVTASATSYNTSSDYRLKENVVELTDATSRLKELQPKRFNFIGQEMTVDGFIAHEVQAVVPEAVVGEKDGEEFQQMDAAKLIPLLVATIKELEERITILEGK